MKSRNIKFCAFLKLKGHNPIEVVKLARGRAEYVFNISESDWDKYQVEFNSSPFLDYANALEALKDLAY